MPPVSVTVQIPPRHLKALEWLGAASCADVPGRLAEAALDPELRPGLAAFLTHTGALDKAVRPATPYPVQGPLRPTGTAAGCPFGGSCRSRRNGQRRGAAHRWSGRAGARTGRRRGGPAHQEGRAGGGGYGVQLYAHQHIARTRAPAGTAAAPKAAPALTARRRSTPAGSTASKRGRPADAGPGTKGPVGRLSVTGTSSPRTITGPAAAGAIRATSRYRPARAVRTTRDPRSGAAARAGAPAPRRPLRPPFPAPGSARSPATIATSTRISSSASVMPASACRCAGLARSSAGLAADRPGHGRGEPPWPRRRPVRAGGRRAPAAAPGPKAPSPGRGSAAAAGATKCPSPWSETRSSWSCRPGTSRELANGEPGGHLPHQPGQVVRLFRPPEPPLWVSGASHSLPPAPCRVRGQPGLSAVHLRRDRFL